MAAMALRLGVRLAKPGVYTLHAAGRGADAAAVQLALGLARQAAWLAVGLAVVALATRAAWPGWAP
jgi:adenosylcobinamide-phosphate synthase